MDASAHTAAHELPAGPGPELPRLLAAIPAHGHMSLHQHEALRGPLPADERARSGGRRGTSSPLIDEIEAAGLSGRGGAGFASATKLRAVANARGRSVVVVNATEGEPASGKDRALLEVAPHLVLDGAQLAAGAVGADEVIVAVCELGVSSVEAVTLAIEERAAAMDPRDTPKIELALVPPHYVAGQETALVNYLNAGQAVPTFTPPRVYESGVGGRPTLVNNPETLANIALVARYGAGWFRELGTAAEPGSVLITVSGPVKVPGVYEIELGTSLGALVGAAGGLRGGIRAALIGGYAGTWLDGSQALALGLSGEALGPHGASLGAGVALLLSEDACPVAETARLARWLAGQSARQCGPCLHGLDALAAAIEALAAGRPQERASARIERLAALTAGRGACGHPDGAARVLISALRLFWDEATDHARNGECDACRLTAELPLPSRPVNSTRAARRASG
jgi:NADH:ubiquinone oxidoreductase subunit F (NADH-binding)